MSSASALSWVMTQSLSSSGVRCFRASISALSLSMLVATLGFFFSLLDASAFRCLLAVLLYALR